MFRSLRGRSKRTLLLHISSAVYRVCGLHFDDDSFPAFSSYYVRSIPADCVWAVVAWHVGIDFEASSREAVGRTANFPVVLALA